MNMKQQLVYWATGPIGKHKDGLAPGRRPPEICRMPFKPIDSGQENLK